MSDDSNNAVRDTDRIRYHEPVTIRLYGVKEISLPTYLMWYLATIILVVALIAGCNEIMQPQTKFGEGIRRSIEREGWVLDAVEWARRMEGLGAGEILLTSMDRDGAKIGFDIALTRTVADAVGIPVIASGGVGTLDHLVEGVTLGHASAVLAASIFHFGTYSISEAHAALRAAGLPARGV